MRYHTRDEYAKLKPERKKEIKEWSASQQDVKKQNVAAVKSLQDRIEALSLQLEKMSQPVSQSIKAAKSALKPKNPLKPPVHFNQRSADKEEKPDP